MMIEPFRLKSILPGAHVLLIEDTLLNLLVTVLVVDGSGFPVESVAFLQFGGLISIATFSIEGH